MIFIAYEVLSDEDKRKKYDAYGHGAFGGGGDGGPSGGEGQAFHFNFDEFFKNFDMNFGGNDFGGGGDSFQFSFGGGGQRAQKKDGGHRGNSFFTFEDFFDVSIRISI